MNDAKWLQTSAGLENRSGEVFEVKERWRHRAADDMLRPQGRLKMSWAIAYEARLLGTDLSML